MNDEEIVKAARAVKEGYLALAQGILKGETTVDIPLHPFWRLVEALGATLKQKDDAEARRAEERRLYEEQTRDGRRVRVVRLGPGSDYQPGTRTHARVGQVGTVFDVASGHGSCVHVRHDDGTDSWYDLPELGDA